MIYNDAQLEWEIDKFNDEVWEKLPLVVEGESKIVKYLGEGFAVTKLKPTIYSFSQNRCAVVEGSDIPRYNMTKYLTKLLIENGIDHAYKEFRKGYIFQKLLVQEAYPNCPKPFMPDDLESYEIEQLKIVPPIEVVIKSFHTGTTKHSMYGMSGSKIRKGHPLFPGYVLKDEEPYPMPMVRFDWRNPLKDAEGNRLEDKALCDDQANWFINVETTKQTALKAYKVINQFLNDIDVVCYDLCMFFSTDGKTMYGEISPDCGRFRHFDHGSLDKDIWRGGGSSEMVLEKWNLMSKLVENYFTKGVVE